MKALKSISILLLHTRSAVEIGSAFHSHPFRISKRSTLFDSLSNPAFVAFQNKQITCNSNAHHQTIPSSPTAINSANLITFDLDDTIFPVGPVVHDANLALIKHLNDECGYDSITEESLITSTKKIRTELKDQDKVITYTELRQRAICNEMNQYNNMKNQKGDGIHISYTDDIVVQAYDLWEHNRHLAAERHLYHDTIQMFQSLKEKYPSAIIGAITNGKGNPLKMKQTIHHFFDFCISGEDDDVFPDRKPNEGIYIKSLDRFYDVLGIPSDNVEMRSVEHYNWIHVGDDLANDVGASSKCGAFAVWVDLIGDKYNQSASKRFGAGQQSEKSAADPALSTARCINDGTSNKEIEENQQQQPFWSTATKDEIEKRKKLNDESMRYISARIETLSSLPQTIESVLLAPRESAPMK